MSGGAASSIRATVRGAREGIAEPRVVDPADPAGRLVTDGHGRGTLVTTGGGEPTRHRVLLASHDSSRQPGQPGTRHVEVVIDGWRFEVEVELEQRAALREKARRDRGATGQSGPAEVRAIIPGVVVSVAVAPGDAVEAGQQLLVVEAMKMQNELRAPRAGTVQRVTVGERSTIEVGDILVVIE